MGNMLNDKKLMSDLECIFNTDIDVFLCLKKTVSDVRESALQKIAEAAFVERNMSSHYILRVAPDYQNQFAAYIEMGRPAGQYFYCFRHDYEFGAVYVVDGDGRIKSKRYIYDSDRALDIYQTFTFAFKTVGDMARRVELPQEQERAS